MPKYSIKKAIAASRDRRSNNTRWATSCAPEAGIVPAMPSPIFAETIPHRVSRHRTAAAELYVDAFQERPLKFCRDQDNLVLAGLSMLSISTVPWVARPRRWNFGSMNGANCQSIPQQQIRFVTEAKKKLRNPRVPTLRQWLLLPFDGRGRWGLWFPGSPVHQWRWALPW